MLTQFTEFAYGKVDPHQAGQEGGKTSGTTGSTGSSGAGSDDNSGSNYKPTEHDGLREDGQPDGRVKQ